MAATGVRCAITDAFTGPKGKALKMFSDVLLGEGQHDGATAGDSRQMSELRKRMRSLPGLEVKES